MRGYVAILVILAIGAVTGLALRRRARRRRADELLQHPERLDQMLDKTDDA